VIHGVAGGDGVNVDVGGAEGIADAGQHARPIIQEQSQLSCYLHNFKPQSRRGGRRWFAETITRPEKIAIGRRFFLLILRLRLVAHFA
jgi:hypothetical protein